MAKYRVYFEGTASASIVVEADDKDDAVEKAYADGIPGICADCCGFGRTWSQQWPDYMEASTDDETGEELVELVEEG